MSKNINVKSVHCGGSYSIGVSKCFSTHVWTCTRTSGVPNLNLKNVFSLHVTLLQSVKTGSFKTNLIRTYLRYDTANLMPIPSPAVRNHLISMGCIVEQGPRVLGGS
jgi:hypothetical protein